MLFSDYCAINKITFRDGMCLFSKNNNIPVKTQTIPFIGDDLERFYIWDRDLNIKPEEITIDTRLQCEMDRRLKTLKPNIQSILRQNFIKYGTEAPQPRTLLKIYLGITDCFSGLFSCASKDKKSQLYHICVTHVKFAQQFDKGSILTNHLWINVPSFIFKKLSDKGLVRNETWLLFYGVIQSYTKHDPKTFEEIEDYRIKCKDIMVVQ